MDLHVGIANCPIAGERFSVVRGDDGDRRLRNHIQFRLSGYIVDLYQRSDVVVGPVSKMVGHWVYTTDMFIRDVESSDVNGAERLARDLCSLLSLGTASQVMPFRYDYGSHSRVESGRGVTLFFRPLIEIRNGEAVQQFVQTTWVAFRLQKRRRKLREVFDYLVTAELPQQPIEVKLLLAFVTLENLKATYARGQGLQFVSGAFRKISTPPLPNPKREPKYSFGDLLEEMFDEVGMSPSLKRVIALRNQIVHFGLSTRKAQREVYYYDLTRSLIQEYLLRLLNFRGWYFDYLRGDFERF